MGDQNATRMTISRNVQRAARSFNQRAAGSYNGYARVRHGRIEKLAVKVVDIFGNDTMKIIEVTV